MAAVFTSPLKRDDKDLLERWICFYNRNGSAGFDPLSLHMFFALLEGERKLCEEQGIPTRPRWMLAAGLALDKEDDALAGTTNAQ